MPLCTGRPCLWPLILSLCLNSVTSLNFNINAPKTWWLDDSCPYKGFARPEARESMQMATLGAKRLLNTNDQYQGAIFNLLQKIDRDFTLRPEGVADTEAWNVVEVEAWIGAMMNNYQPLRKLADVRIYCDDDERWTRVPDDHVAMTRGVPLNSLREFGDDAEYEDLENFMRRDSRNEGCQKDLTLGVTYSAMSPTSDSRVPGNYRKPRQTVSLCNNAFRSRMMSFAAIEPEMWEIAPVAAMNTIPTFVLLYQLLNLEPYGVQRSRDVAFAGYQSSEDLWRNMLRLPARQLSRQPAPYTWNAVLAYAASIGWGLRAGLTMPQYIAGQGLFQYSEALINIPFARGGPITLPGPMQLPPGFVPVAQ